MQNKIVVFAQVGLVLAMMHLCVLWIQLLNLDLLQTHWIAVKAYFNMFITQSEWEAFDKW